MKVVRENGSIEKLPTKEYTITELEQILSGKVKCIGTFVDERKIAYINLDNTDGTTINEKVSEILDKEVWGPVIILPYVELVTPV